MRHPDARGTDYPVASPPILCPCCLESMQCPVPDDLGVRLQVRQEGVPDRFLRKERVARVRVKITGARSELELPPMPAEPKAVKFNDFEGVLADLKMVGWQN
jgi:hypothetical protein